MKRASVLPLFLVAAVLAGAGETAVAGATRSWPTQASAAQASGEHALALHVPATLAPDRAPATQSPAAQVPAAQPAAPAPDTNPLLAAKTVVVIGAAGTQTTNRDIWNPNGSRASLKVEEAMRDWGRYKVIFRVEDADLVLVVTELQKDFGPSKPARLVAELKVYPGHQQPTPDTPILWSDEAVELGGKQPSAKVAEMFKDYVKKLKTR